MTIHNYKQCDIYFMADYVDTTLPENAHIRVPMNGTVEAFEMTQEQYLDQFHISTILGTSPEGFPTDFYTIQLKNYDINGSNKGFMVRLFEHLAKGFKDITKIEDIDFKEENLEVFV